MAGIPGSGKTTTAGKLSQVLGNSKVIPMDGFHLYRKDLDEEGVRRRGASFTFDRKLFREKLMKLKENREGKFPGFDHSEKDPKEDLITIDNSVKYVIVEGLYLFYPEWDLNNVWDLKLWMECPVELAMQRVAKRHFDCGIEPSMERAWERTNGNDYVNAEEIIEKSDLEKAINVKGY